MAAGHNNAILLSVTAEERVPTLCNLKPGRYCSVPPPIAAYYELLEVLKYAS